jgi:hypothetical protein
MSICSATPNSSKLPKIEDADRQTANNTPNKTATHKFSDIKVSSDQKNPQQRQAYNPGEEKNEKPLSVLEFVNLGTSPVLDEKSRGRVRSHAMLDFNRRKAEPGSVLDSMKQENDTCQSETTNPSVPSVTRWRLAGTRARQSKKNREQEQCSITSYGSKALMKRSSFLQPPDEIATYDAQIFPDYKTEAICQHPENAMRGSIHKQPSLAEVQLNFLGSGNLDPFKTLPLADSRRTQALIVHCKKCPLDGTWFCRTDAFRPHVTL